MTDSAERVIGLLADPGAPEAIAAKIAPGVSEGISQQLDQRWRAEVSRETLPLSRDGTIQLVEHAPHLRRRHGWDALVYLSDLPRYEDDGPMLAEISTAERAALITVPALGSLRVTSRARELVPALLGVALGQDADTDTVARSFGPPGLRARKSSSASDLVRLVLTGGFGRAQVLGGMVRSNRPGQLLTALTGGIAAALAAGAFGIFYGSLASVADALSLWRLGLISVLAVSVLATWLIFRNNLWNFGKGRDEIWRQGLDNASTVLTVGLSVLLLYIGLVVAMLALAVVVLAPGYLHSELQRPVGALEYLKLAWLSAGMGTMAGALGANFDHEDAVREATFNRRYHERRELFESYQERAQE